MLLPGWSCDVINLGFRNRSLRYREDNECASEKSLGQRRGPGRAQKRCWNRKTRRINCTTRELNAGSREKEKEKRGWRIASKGLLWELSFAALPASHGQQQRTPSPRPRLCPQYLSLLELERRAFPAKGTYIVFSFALSSLLPLPSLPVQTPTLPKQALHRGASTSSSPWL